VSVWLFGGANADRERPRNRAREECNYTRWGGCSGDDNRQKWTHGRSCSTAAPGHLRARHGADSGSRALALAGFALVLCLYCYSPADRLLIDPSEVDENLTEQLVSSARVLD
jgi:hypothetical protein